jgi:hypothetical protein
VLAHFVPVVVVTFLMLLEEHSADARVLFGGAVLVFWTLLALGGLLDGRRWAHPVEAARLVALAGVAAVALRGGPV